MTVPNVTNQSSEYELKVNEAAELVSFPTEMNYWGIISIFIEKGGRVFTYRAIPSVNTSTPKPPLEPLIVTGPAVIRLHTGNTAASGLCTFRITPEAYPPDRSTIVMPGTNGGARVTLEASTNLVHWAPATNGAYTNLPVAQFFRIAVEPIAP